jgi:hypothetical protein
MATWTPVPTWVPSLTAGMSAGSLARWADAGHRKKNEEKKEKEIYK